MERVQSERRVWNAERGSFTPMGEAMKPPTVKRARFLKGPVPWFWIVAAAALPGKALPVGLCLWRLAGAMKNQTVTLGNSDLVPLGIDRASKSRALRALEGAGLIEVVRQRGRFPIVTLPAAGVQG